ncbi:uncharacterized protein LOC141760720 isoform X4 [Sebastes fasciatus]|uniref:uncharacterized protein LOC141760720 isoform X4 n=1 Tax=Sebastes fasciatus TaxID=394691 RepID=UPI003D9E9FE3
MSAQVCHCGWSTTTYKGLRIHQGKMGCTPKGMKISESEQFLFNSYRPTLTYVGPPIFIFNTADMSTQVCHCGWSSVTTYQGLRIHQGKMGCTLKGMKISESEQFLFNSYRPTLTYVGPPIMVEEPSMSIFNLPAITAPETTARPKEREKEREREEQRKAQKGPPIEAAEPWKCIFTPPLNSERDQYTFGNQWRDAHQKDSGPVSGTIPVRQEEPPIKAEEPLKTIFNPPLNSETNQYTLGNQWRESHQKNSGPFNWTTQEPPIKAEEPLKTIFNPPLNSETNQYTFGNQWRDAHQKDSGPVSGTIPEPPIKAEEPLKTIFNPPLNSERDQYTLGNQWRESHQKNSGPINWTTQNVPVSQNFPAPMTSTEAAIIGMFKSGMEAQQHSLQMYTISDKSHGALDFTGGAQTSLMPMSQIFGTQVNHAAAEFTVKETNRSAFETPPHYSTTHQTTGNARRVLDFSSGAQQVDQLFWDVPTTTAQETEMRQKESEKEKEKEKEREREAQKLQKVKRDRIAADLQQKIQTREQKMAEVRSSVTACKGGLDAEWLQINNVFSEVMKVVEDARQKALQPLEERRQRVKREAHDLVQKLQKEIDKLKKTIDELDKNPDLQDSSLTGLVESRDWKNVTLDTSFSFGSLRTTTSNMMEQIHQKLEKLSSVELKRIPTFAVDVKLDPASAHRCLVLSDDGKMVKDGGMRYQRVPDAPQMFDMFGSIVGLNRMTSGKFYWEVEVTKKTGWDLGVAGCDANRRGKLSLNPDNGYWVIVHYKGEKYAALTEPPVPLPLKEKAQTVGVFVDYEEGLVSFYDVTAQSHIYSFTECSFSKKIFPYFSPHPPHNGKNSYPLIISAVKRQ